MEDNLLTVNDYGHYKRMDSIDKEKYMTNLKEKYAPKVKKEFKLKILENLKAGITVGLVNLPMCIAFAAASGVSPELGVLAGIWGGIIGGLLGGSYYNVLGPAGALIGFIYKFVTRWGPESLPWCCFFCALFTFIFYIFKLGKYVDVFPVAINEGFTLAVAFSIFFGQISNALSLPPIPVEHHGDEEENILETIARQLAHADQMHKQSFLIFIVFLVLLLYLSKAKPQIPWIIPVIVVGIVFGYLDTKNIIPIGFVTLQKKFGDIQLKLFIMPKIPEETPYMLLTPGFYVDCVPIAFVSLLECLISAKIADAVTNTKFNVKREMKGLSAANLITGICGGFPGTAALPRTALNIKSGATHKYSSLISSIVLLLIAFICMPLFQFLPLCFIASQMCYVAIKMVNFEEIEALWNNDQSNFKLLIFVFVVGVITDPIVGIFLGFLIFQLIFSENMFHPYSEIITYDDSEKSAKENISSNFIDIPEKAGKYIIYRFIGSINFMNIGVHKERIFTIAKEDDAVVVLSMRYLNVSDKHSLEALKMLIDQIENADNSTAAKRVIPKNMKDEFVDDNGEIIKPQIEADDETHQQFDVKPKKIIVSGITQDKMVKLNDPEFFHELKEKGQLYLAQGVKILGYKTEF